jgi:hypothetical protein
MTHAVSDDEVREAMQVLEGDRARLAATFAPAEPDRHDRFPRSATFRWLTARMAGRSLAATAGAVLLRMAVRRLLRRATAR